MKAHCFKGSDFTGVRVELHHSQAQFLKRAVSAIPGASVVVARPGPGWGARVYATSSVGHQALTFFWDEGHRSIKEALSEMGCVTDWID